MGRALYQGLQGGRAHILWLCLRQELHRGKRKAGTGSNNTSKHFAERQANDLCEVAERWLFNASLRVKPSTYAHYSAMLSNHVLPAIGNRKAQLITTEMVDRFARDMLRGGRKDGSGGLSPKTVRDILSVTKSVLDYARAERLANPDLTITYPKRGNQTIRVLSKQEQLALERVLMDKPDIIKLGILLCLYTGLRLGEICALRWRDISLDKHMISVRQTMQRVQNIEATTLARTSLLIGTPKSLHSEREVPMPTFFSSHLAHYTRSGDRFFLSNAEFDHIEPRTLQNHFKRQVTAAGIAPANYHALRHTFATRCIEAGVDIKSLSEMLGHSNVNITLNRYVHSSFEQKREGISKLEQFSGFAVL